MKFTSAVTAALAVGIVAAAPTANKPEPDCDKPQKGHPQPVHHPKPPKNTPGLAQLAQKAGLLYFGTAVDNPAFNNSQYLSIAYDKKEFNQVTPANGQKWMLIEPEQNVFDYSAGDQVIVPSIKAGQLRRCHNLVWHSQLPEWLTNPAKPWTKKELTAILDNHIKNEVNHYKGQCYAWDVLNEALNDNGTYRQDLWLDTFGPDYIPLVFKLAAKYEKHAKLYYNDYNIENINNKSLAVKNEIIPSIRRAGGRIDGVGMQAHFIAGSTPSYDQQTANMRQFTKLGLEVAITELDVRMELPETAEKDAQQAIDYATSVKACLDVKGCVGVTVWDFYDPFSWVPSTFPGEGAADLWFGNFTKKPAYYSVAKVLGAK